MSGNTVTALVENIGLPHIICMRSGPARTVRVYQCNQGKLVQKLFTTTGLNWVIMAQCYQKPIFIFMQFLEK